MIQKTFSSGKRPVRDGPRFGLIKIKKFALKFLILYGSGGDGLLILKLNG
jgi:hypothetical protein